MNDKILQEIANNIAELPDVYGTGLNIGFNDEAHNMLFGAFEDITTQLKRIADALEEAA
jgi:hypothetical protein